MEKTAILQGGVARRRAWPRAAGYLYPLLPLLIVIPLWDFVVTWFEVPSILFPDPFSVAVSFVEGVTSGYDKAGFWYHAVTTATESLAGLAIGIVLGVSLGMLLGLSRVLERSFYPYVVAFQGLPKMALAPVFIVWFGFGIASKIALVMLITFFPVLVNTWAGIKSASPEMIKMALSFDATQRQVFRFIVFPSALPYIFAGLEIAVMYSITGAIVSEFVGAQRGLGFLIDKMNYALDMPGLFAIFVFLLICGYLANLALAALRRRCLFWIAAERARVGA